MSVYRVELSQQTPALRWYRHDEATFAEQALLAERPLPADALEKLTAAVDKKYRVGSPDMFALGRQLYEFLDGPDRWLCPCADGLGGSVWSRLKSTAESAALFLCLNRFPQRISP